MKKTSQLSRTIIVLGKARSGTSMTAGILSIFGVDMNGDDSPTPFNPHGAYEDIDFNDIDTEILESAGGDYLLHPPSYENILKQKQKYDLQLRNFFEQKAKKSLWGWKKPATILLLDIYLPYVKNPHFIVVTRDPQSNAISLLDYLKPRHPSVTLARCLEIVSEFNKRMSECIQSHPEIPALHISFESLTLNPVIQAKRIAEFLDITFQEKHAEAVQKFVISRNKIGKQKNIALFLGLPHKVKRILLGCWKDPKAIKTYFLQFLRLLRNRFL